MPSALSVDINHYELFDVGIGPIGDAHECRRSVPSSCGRLVSVWRVRGHACADPRLSSTLPRSRRPVPSVPDPCGCRAGRRKTPADDRTLSSQTPRENPKTRLVSESVEQAMNHLTWCQSTH